MNKIFFSIIIPVFNSEKFLSKCVSSVINQRINGVEIIIIEDNSTDKSKSICEKIKKKNFKLIKLIKNKKNLGVASSRNKALKVAKGKYLIFLDSDDYLEKDSLKFLKEKILNDNYPEVILNHISQSKNPTTNLDLLNLFGKKKLSKIFFLSKIIKKKILINECWRIVVLNSLIKKNKISFQNIKIAEDLIFVFEVFFVMKNIIINPEKFLFHRSRLNSLKYSAGINSATAYYVAYLKLNRYFLKYKKNRHIEKRFIELTLENIYSNLKIYFSLIEDNQASLLVEKIRKINKLTLIKSQNFISKIKAEYENQILKIINYKLRKKKSLVIYCYSIMTQSVVKILIKKNIKILCIIDDDKIWRGRNFMNIEIKKFDTLFNKNLKNSLIMICNNSNKVIENIRLKLQNYKINKKQLINLSI